ncbi:hypothetical protein FOA52_009988 [Chlamydomonas sp. UWO 241]|nr:hypothetical protein FOA52_009988 [Chlamydomonas sp. UWO 241]
MGALRERILECGVLPDLMTALSEAWITTSADGLPDLSKVTKFAVPVILRAIQAWESDVKRIVTPSVVAAVLTISEGLWELELQGNTHASLSISDDDEWWQWTREMVRFLVDSDEPMLALPKLRAEQPHCVTRDVYQGATYLSSLLNSIMTSDDLPDVVPDPLPLLQALLAALRTQLVFRASWGMWDRLQWSEEGRGTQLQEDDDLQNEEGELSLARYIDVNAAVGMQKLLGLLRTVLPALRGGDAGVLAAVVHHAACAAWAALALDPTSHSKHDEETLVSTHNQAAQVLSMLHTAELLQVAPPAVALSLRLLTYPRAQRPSKSGKGAVSFLLLEAQTASHLASLLMVLASKHDEQPGALQAVFPGVSATAVRVVAQIKSSVRLFSTPASMLSRCPSTAAREKRWALEVKLAKAAAKAASKALSKASKARAKPAPGAAHDAATEDAGCGQVNLETSAEDSRRLEKYSILLQLQQYEDVGRDGAAALLLVAEACAAVLAPQKSQHTRGLAALPLLRELESTGVLELMGRAGDWIGVLLEASAPLLEPEAAHEATRPGCRAADDVDQEDRASGTVRSRQTQQKSTQQKAQQRQADVAAALLAHMHARRACGAAAALMALAGGWLRAAHSLLSVAGAAVAEALAMAQEASVGGDGSDTSAVVDAADAAHRFVRSLLEDTGRSNTGNVVLVMDHGRSKEERQAAVNAVTRKDTTLALLCSPLAVRVMSLQPDHVLRVLAGLQGQHDGGEVVLVEGVGHWDIGSRRGSGSEAGDGIMDEEQSIGNHSDTHAGEASSK